MAKIVAVLLWDGDVPLTNACWKWTRVRYKKDPIGFHRQLNLTSPKDLEDIETHRMYECMLHEDSSRHDRSRWCCKFQCPFHDVRSCVTKDK